MDLSNFIPHGVCLAWDPGLVWLQAGSDSLIAAAYYSIPITLALLLAGRRDLAFRPIFWLFAAFILACGTTHILGVVILWRPLYWLDGAVKALTAALSVTTAIVLWPLVPKALSPPSANDLQVLNDALAREIQERDATSAALRASRAELARLYARSPAALHATDLWGRLLDVSDRWLDLLGYTRAEVIGRSIGDFYIPEDRDAFAAQLAQFREGAGAPAAERRMLCKFGQVRDVEIVFDLERSPDGRLQRILAAVTDDTAHHAAEAALRASEDRLRQAQKMEAVGQLTGGIAHDFNNLLTAVVGSLDLLKSRGGIDDRGHRLVGTALEASMRATKLTSQLLSFSRRQRLSPEALDGGEVIAGIRELLDRTMGESIELSVSTAPDIWPFEADRNQVEAALLNLVINARDAIGGAGQVRIVLANRTLSQPEIEGMSPELLAPGDFVAIRVEDTGPGMPASVRERAFEPFFTTKPPGAGTGLGLAQIYGFARQSGGTAWIDSRPGKGTQVEILLPRATRPATKLAPLVPAPIGRPVPGDGDQTPGHRRLVLLVEDNDLLRETMVDALQDMGFSVIAAADGPSALAWLERGMEIGLLFTDVAMPGGLNGVELALLVRARRPCLPVLFTTGFTDRSVLAKWPEPLDLLSKPYSVNDLAARVMGAMGMAG